VWGAAMLIGGWALLKTERRREAARAQPAGGTRV
jgi:hypothetical protein